MKMENLQLNTTITKNVIDRLDDKMNEMEERICECEDRTIGITLSNRQEID